jgi:uncharacterized protein (DUF4415 family)
MTAKSKKNTDYKTRKAEAARPRPKATVESELMRLAEEYVRPGARWNRPVKQRISLRLDQEVVEWLKSLGTGYTTRVNLILRTVMLESKKRKGWLGPGKGGS